MLLSLVIWPTYFWMSAAWPAAITLAGSVNAV